MRLGDLTRWLAFDAPTKVSDGMGGFVNTFTLQFTVKGAYWPLSGVEQITALSLSSPITGKVRIRYKPNVKILTSWRIRVGSITLNIVSAPINLGGTNQFWEIKVKEAT